MKKQIQIAIDGPAGAGKSTVAKIVAEQLGFTYIDTGAMYRAATYKALKENIKLNDENKLEEMLLRTDIDLKPSPNGQLVFLDGEDVTKEIRSNEVTANVPQVASLKKVREILVAKQRELAKGGGVVMDGRDIATNVLKDAELKIFMTASVEERAKRRLMENQKKGIPSDFEKLKEEIALRDKQDMEREISPLVQAEDAIFLDTTHLSIEEVADKILQLAQEKMG